MKWLLILLAGGVLTTGAVFVVPSLSDDFGDELDTSDSLRAGAVAKAERIAAQAVEAVAAEVASVQLTPELAADVNERVRQECEHLQVLHADLGLEFRFADGVAELGRWRVEPACEAVPR
ncbi:hypothetical protein [Candidatus Poriferisodalis sp.]|uniref:hypothetical protein n=1 Tax=Candidatus Poriferisodalis sp. TaxID=3101277 RepID=UPI003B025A7A